MQEDQKSMCDWAEATFGPVNDVNNLVERAYEEMHELAVSVKSSDRVNIMEEVADVVILLNRLSTELGFDLKDAVNQKMTKNRTRKWQSAGDGTGRHI